MNPIPRSLRRVLSRALFALPVSLVFPLAPAVFAVDGTWILDGGGAWDPATPGTTLWSGNIVAQGADFTADFSTLDITADRTITLGAPVSIGNLKFGDTSGAQNWTLAGGSTLTLDKTAAPAPTITVNNNKATISAALAGNDGMVKAGAGKLVLSGGHAFTGTIEVSAGTLDLWDTAGAYTNNITLSASGSTLDAANALSSTVTVSGNIIGSGKINKTSSSSVLVLTGDNTYSGGTTLGAGTIAVGNGLNNSIGTGTLTLSGGAFRATDNTSRTFANAISMGSIGLRFGGLQGDSTGLGDLNFTWAGSTSIGGSKTWTVNNATKVSFNNNWSGNSSWNVTKAGTGTLVFNGNLTGSGVGLVVSSGTMALNGATNSYSGTTTVNGGTLQVGGAVTNSVITVNTGGRIGGTGSVGAVTFNSGAALAYEVATAGQGGDGLTTTGFTGGGVGNFTIYLSGAATGFDASSNYTWAVLSSNSTDISSIVLANLTLDTTGFGQAYTGSFNLSKDAGTIYVNYAGTLIPEPSTYAVLSSAVFLGFAVTRRRRV